MAKNPASYQKRQRELDKKRKAEDKRKRREQQKNMPPIREIPHLSVDDEKPEIVE